MADTSPLISTADLAAMIGDPRLKIIDASWHLDARDGRTEFEAERIPGAVFFDLDAVSDHTTDLPHMLPTAAAFAGATGALGIAETDTTKARRNRRARRFVRLGRRRRRAWGENARTSHDEY